MDPPAELPVVPSRYPVILHSLVVPAANNPLLELPAVVYCSGCNDPNRSFFYSLFVDLNLSDLPSIQDQTEVTDKGANIKVLAFPPPRDLTKGCHRIELLVSYTQPVWRSGLGFNHLVLHTAGDVALRMFGVRRWGGADAPAVVGCRRAVSAPHLCPSRLLAGGACLRTG